MGSKITDRSGSVLLESVIALLVLCQIIVSVMLLAGLMIKGHTQAETTYEEAFELNSLRDQIADGITALSEPDPAVIVTVVGSIVAAREGWRFQLLSGEGGLIDLLLVHEMVENTHEYRIKIYVP